MTPSREAPVSDQPGLGTTAAAGAQATQSGREARAVLGSRRIVVVLGGFLVPVVILGAWQLVTAFGLVPASQLPAPAEVWAAGVDLAQRGWLQQDVAISVQRVLIGFLIGAVLGLVLGAVVGLSRLGDILLSTTFAAIRAVPSLAWVPLLILWLKIGEESKITLIAIGAFFPVYTTVSAALRHVDKHLVEAGRAFGLNGVALFRTVQLPAVTPSVVSGLRLALAQSWLFLVAAELIASSMGLGFRLVDSQNNGRVDRIFFVIIVLALLGAITDALVGVLDRWIKRRWG
ncbi:ABC transporter permease [Plantibacter sp. VKM Ac-2885]|uniref:ABC transporter permease n=1 Tax=unclassified Plantibacter TaxID=2624265 RepID=UPI00188D7B80|nr:ABC transporter permease [Plantibacter sp. VKM Ac-2885]MBD8534966.1 ABC transporter permease [Plantibacter sp. CFBP 13570]MBF4511803.1 ABC transporter permease [Plantibacter sp. VKM Ac-2885]